MRLDRGATTKAWSRWRVAALLAASSLVALSACTGLFRTDVPIPTLLVSPAVQRAGGWEIQISVANMPDGGVAGIAIKDNAFTTTDIDVDTLWARGLNDFQMWYYDFWPPYPQGALCATNAFRGVESGGILVLRFEATGPAPSIAIDPAQVELGSDANTPIGPFVIAYGVTYHIKEAGAR